MKNTVEKNIENAKYFQQNGSFDLAISSLEKARFMDIHKSHEIEVEKLLAFQSENEETARWFAYMREHIWEHA